jgi:hypothetical protein
MKIAQLLDRDIRELGVAAPGLPEGTVAWTAESARRLLDSLRTSKIAIADIEVYDRVVWGFAPAGESWACQRAPGELAWEFALRSRADALEWVNAFPRHNVLFILEFNDQESAAEASGLALFDDDPA